ncbi:NlpC/P60 family protein [Bacillus sp. NPDC094106]|uniref:NlpC/P60 family protein n=1 Tax=Bacillus sp. NPDC094106 TaxID=3363949 RepID=UPI00381570C2
MNEDNRNGTDTTSNVAEEQMNKAMQKGSKKAGKAVFNTLKKGAKMILKAVFTAIKSLVLALFPYILIAILIFYIFTVIFDTIFESRGKEQGYQMEDEKHDNKLKKNEKGQWEAINLSPGNKVVKAFYTYFSDRSYYITIEDEKKLYSPDDTRVKTDNIKDKYDREKMFYLSPNVLWTLDEFLFDNKFRFPEQFLRPVYHDPETFESKPLTNDKGMLVAESNSYDSKTWKRIEDKKEKGVWDYGFAPILHYKQYAEQKEGRGKVVYQDVWDESSQQVIQKQNISEGNQAEHKKAVEGYPKTVWMIDKVASPAGNITNKIINEWKDTGERYEEKIPFKQTVSKSRMVTKTREKADEPGVTETYEEKEWYQEEITMFKYAEGTMWEQTPEYDGEPDTSGVTGNRYFRDYLENFKSYVPLDARMVFNIEARTNKDIKELEALLKEHDEKEAQSKSQSGGQVDMGEFKLGEGASSENYKKSLQYIEIFKKYGEMFGVDPYLLVAKASQESGGDHEGSLPGGRGYNGAAVGLMQVEKPGQVITSLTAYNFQTHQEETMKISGPGDVTAVDANIKAGTMEFASRLKDNQYNVLLSIQAYNYGPGGTKAILDLYSKESGKSVDEIKKNTGDTGWMKFRDEVHNNPSKYFRWSGGTYGDPKYIEHVLRYYASPESKAPYVTKEDGTKVLADGNLEVGSASGLEVKGGGDGGFASLIKGIFGKLKECWGQLFPDKPHYDPINPFPIGGLVENRIKESRSQDVINMMFVMEEQKYLSEFDNMTDEMWKERYSQLFKNPLGTSWGGKKNGLDVKKLFPDGFQNPVDINPPTIVKKFGLVPKGEGKELHQAIDILAPNGTEIKSVSDKGKVINISTTEGGYLGKMVEVQYKNSTVIYGNLGTVDVKEGQELKKGDKIGTAGGTTEDGEVMHLEVVYKGQRIDATPFVSGEAVQSGGGNGTSTPGGSGPMSIEGSQKAQEIYGYLKEFLGSWYAWGGTTPPKKQANGEWEPARKTGEWIGGYPVEYPGFDCSGFMQYGFKKAGVNIPRTAREQQSWATNIPNEQAQPGDLVFWGRPAHHVGMYIGNNEYIHAPQSNDRIKVSKINNWGSVTSVGRALK